MKAAVFHGPGDMKVEETRKPACPDGGAIIKISGSMICGSDIKICNNGHPSLVPPQILGHEACGIISELNDNCGIYKIGDRVALQPSVPCGRCVNCQKGWFNICESQFNYSLHYPGTFAEYVAVPEQALRMGNLVKAPDALTDEEVCLAEPLACVLNGQELLNIRPGETVLIVGAGPIGILQAEMAKVSGAGKILLADISADRLEMARVFGYTGYINAGSTDLVEEVLRLTDGRGVNVAIVTAPSRGPMEQAAGALEYRGRLSLFGSLKKGDSMISVDSRPIHYKELSVIGASSSSAAHIKRALDILAAGMIDAKNIVTHRLPLDKIMEGIELGAAGKAIKIYIYN